MNRLISRILRRAADALDPPREMSAMELVTTAELAAEICRRNDEVFVLYGRHGSCTADSYLRTVSGGEIFDMVDACLDEHPAREE